MRVDVQLVKCAAVPAAAFRPRSAASASASAAHIVADAASSINLKALHQKWDAAYRTPFGAVLAGTAVTLRLRTASQWASRDTIVIFFTRCRAGNGVATATSFVNNVMAMVQNYARPAILSSMNLVDSHDTERILNDLGGNKNELKSVATSQISWLGAPTIYYGDEAGQAGATDPDDLRTFPWDHQDIDLEGYSRKLIAIRAANLVLGDGGVLPLLSDNAHRVVSIDVPAPSTVILVRAPAFG